MTSAAEDPRVTAFLGAQSEDDATRALERLFDAATDRLLVECVRRGMHGSARQAADVEDAASDTRVRLIRRLWSLKSEGGATIEDFAAYVATTATRTCYAHLRARFPARTRFRNQVRYSVSRHPDTTLEETDGVWWCRSRALRAAPPKGALQQFIDAPAAFLARHRIDHAAPLPHLVAAVLAKLETAIELDRLVDALTSALGIVDARTADSAEGEPILERLPDPAPGSLRALSDREELQRLWNEVVELPINQRVALLLNLRDPDGGAALHALPATGLVTRNDIARTLEMPAAVLDEMWDELPLDDLAVAARLGLTRQQVINLRKSARARLARRSDR